MMRRKPFWPSAAMAAMMTAMMTAMMNDAGYRTYHEFSKLPKTIPPWHGINLSKAERKGKTFEQLQEMRRARWEETHGKEDC